MADLRRRPAGAWWRGNRKAAGWLVVISAIGIVLALQGWRSKAPAFDMVTYFRSAADLVRDGMVPAYGDVSSYGSFSPPGTAWLMAPGMLLLDDPRLYEKLGSAALHAGTLLGVFLLARETLGRRTAYLATAVYGFSALGLDFAGSLWPIGHPFFYVWTVFLAARWILTRRAMWLAAAVAVCGLGLYQDLAIAPLALVLPVLWLAYRAPVRSLALVGAGVLVLGAWYPYLRFEVDRGFVDLGSLILRHDIAADDYWSAWCDPRLRIVDHTASGGEAVAPPAEVPDGVDGGQPRAPSLVDRVSSKLLAVPHGLVATFAELTRVPGAAVVLALLVLTTTGAELARALRVRRRGSRTWWAPPVAARALGPGKHRRTEVGLIGLAVPWLVLIALAEPGRPERFFWVWPLQAIWLSAFFTRLLPRVAPVPVLAVATTAILALLAAGPVSARLGAWLANGWAGADPDEVRLVEYLAADVRASGRTEAAIGYRTFIYDFMAAYHIVEPRYKVGAEFDLMLEERYGIVNLDTCGEGVRAGDDYRIVQVRPRSGPGEPDRVVNVPLDGPFRLLTRIGLYDVFKRT